MQTFLIVSLGTTYILLLFIAWIFIIVIMFHSFELMSDLPTNTYITINNYLDCVSIHKQYVIIIIYSENIQSELQLHIYGWYKIYSNMKICIVININNYILHIITSIYGMCYLNFSAMKYLYQRIVFFFTNLSKKKSGSEEEETVSSKTLAIIIIILY